MALPWQQVHLIAATEAARAHREMSVDPARPIDPFAALDRAGVLVFRRRLDGVAGLYLPGDVAGGVPGVLINVAHPPTKQRFTAAHELWHHRRDREVVFDTETEWIARGEDHHADRERLAEAFAAWFLMPRQLVTASLARLGLSAARLDAEGAYAPVPAMETSYVATVHHLGDMRLIDQATRDRLARILPQRIKHGLGGPGATEDAWKDIHVVRMRGDERGRDVRAKQGDALVIEASEAPSSGYVWEAAAVAPGLVLVGDEFLAPDAPTLGGRGWHRFIIRVDAPGHQSLRLDLRRPWETRPAVESLQFDITA